MRCCQSNVSETVRLVSEPANLSTAFGQGRAAGISSYVRPWSVRPVRWHAIRAALAEQVIHPARVDRTRAGPGLTTDNDPVNPI